ncbi:hypothetical protein CFC21_087467 [Triticum aestivum]|uniref:KIB1-4 beta-propeller domain-containing protein n=2 Tax=Triticum aestivum TaxID=4565 RepID=A0A9R1IHF5_WHEAT|nr:uncharacterized protein LOC123133873 [Triticum aestivum]KAF7083704.1 hypothetical protein CFC21_087467 [Triticum aestivum]
MSSSTVRKRPPAITAATASSGDISPWTTLHGDLVRLVGWRVLAGDLLDYVRFRAVCPYWRSSTVCPRGHGIVDSRFHTRRWMMLPEGHGLHPREDGKKRFFNLSTGVFVRPRLPVLRDHFVLCPADGMLLVLRPRTYTQGDHPCLLHPFTGDVVELPADITLPENLERRLLPINVFAAVSTSPDGVLGVMVTFQNTPFILFASTNDKRWSLCAFPGFRPHPHASPLSFKGQLYMLQEQISSSEVNILRFDPPWQDHSTTLGLASSSLLSPKLVATCPADKFHLPELVECDSEILVVGNKETTHILIYRLADLAQGKFVPVKSIGGNALLIDSKRNPSFSLSAVPTTTGDTIVLADRTPDKYIFQYHLSSDTWSSRVGGCAEHGCSMECCTCSLIDHMCNTCRCVSKWDTRGGIISPARWNNNQFIANHNAGHI